MPSEFPRRPRLLKGALVAYDSESSDPIPSILIFQYNPERISRTLSPVDASSDPASPDSGGGDAGGTPGPPVETITFTLDLDATDALAQPDADPRVAEHGLLPILSALELLLYPAGEPSRPDDPQALPGSTGIAPNPDRFPVVLFVWGRSRILPVRLVGLSITEEAFDPVLNPIRATVELRLRVLTPLDVREGSVGHGAYLASLAKKKDLARLARGRDSPDIPLVLHDLANVYMEEGQLTQAEPLIRRSLEIREKTLGFQHPDVAHSRKSYASLLRALNRAAEARRIEARARANRKRKR